MDNNNNGEEFVFSGRHTEQTIETDEQVKVRFEMPLPEEGDLDLPQPVLQSEYTMPVQAPRNILSQGTD